MRSGNYQDDKKGTTEISFIDMVINSSAAGCRKKGQANYNDTERLDGRIKMHAANCVDSQVTRKFYL